MSVSKDSKIWKAGYVVPPDKVNSFMLPLATGSFVYSPGLDGNRGELLMVWHAFHPEDQSGGVERIKRLSVHP